MSTTTPSARPMVIRVVFWNFLTCLLVVGGGYWLLQAFTKSTAALSQLQPPVAEAQAFVDWAHTLGRIFWPYVVPASIVFFMLVAFLTVWSLRRLVVPPPAPKTTKKQAQPSEEAKAEMERQMLENNQRFYLHLIAVLQKEGRLLDFFSEDLSQYNDGQIGAAVRNIQENCKKALQSHLSPQAVLKQNEGEEIAVEKDFDPNLIKLVGNVTGKPPFKGIVQHRGWRARKLDLPTFSGRQAPDIIAPAEVEVR